MGADSEAHSPTLSAAVAGCQDAVRTVTLSPPQGLSVSNEDAE